MAISTRRPAKIIVVDQFRGIRVWPTGEIGLETAAESVDLRAGRLESAGARRRGRAAGRNSARIPGYQSMARPEIGPL